MTDRKPTELSVSPLELFFDLVFVFAVTQTVALVANDPTVEGVLGGALVFFMMWWAWSQYTWGINGVGNDRFWVRLALVAAMGLSLFMALVVVDAFSDEGHLFGIAYALVLFVSLALFYAGLGTTEDRRTLLTYLPLAALGGVVVVGGSLLESPWRVVAWVAGMVLEILATISAQGADFKIRPGFFAERHGLFVILALGESIVAVGLTAATGERTAEDAVALAVAFIGSTTIWWLYFGRFAGAAENALRAVTGGQRTVMARDVYTMAHYPLAFGLVLYAVVAEEVVAHPTDPLSDHGVWIFAVSIALIVLGFEAASSRAGLSTMWERAVAAVAVIIAGFVLDVAGWIVIALFAGAMVTAMVLETRRGAVMADGPAR